jgi:hypothetical protein
MITGIGFLGKVVEFLAGDLAKRKFSRDSDKKGQACEAFTRLYYLLVDLEAVTNYLREGAHAVVRDNHPEHIAYYVRDSLRRIKLSSNDYIETFTLLREPLEIFAPEVAKALRTVTAWKFNILWEVSNAFIVETADNGATVVRMNYLKPDERLLEIDLDAYVKRVATGEADRRAEHFEWPEILLYRGDVETAFQHAELNFVSLEDVKGFVEMLDRHASALANGKSALREFLRNNFTVEEILYETKRIEPSWFG